jgi:hypothetical protein
VEGCAWFLGLIIFGAILVIIIKSISSASHRANLPFKDWSNPNETSDDIDPNCRQHLLLPKSESSSSAMVCPHCQIKGKVITSKVKVKIGISGGKATAAVLTGGVSLLATGLSRKEDMTEAYCSNCQNTWHF